MPERAQQDPAITEPSRAVEVSAGPDAGALKRGAGPALDRMIAAADPTRAESALPTDSHPFTAVLGQVFRRGAGDSDEVSPADVRQGELGDCWLVSGMAAIARANPEAIRRLIHDRGDGRYDVTLYLPKRGSRDKQAQVITVDARFPASEGKPIYARGEQADAQGTELWPMLLEKAYASWAGSYAPLNVGEDSGKGLDALTAGSVETHRTMFRSKDHILEDLADADAEHRPVVLASRTPGSADQARAIELGLVWPHAYSLEGVDRGARTVRVRNSDRDDSAITPTVVTLTIDELDRYFQQYAIGPAL